MTTTLITGANKGLGYATARVLVEQGHDVWLAARDEEAGHRAADELGGRFVALDVTDDASVAAARETVEHAGGLDVLVNNAGISEGMRPTLETDIAELESILQTNVVGVARVTLAFLPLLQRSEAPVIVNVSSGLGSLSRALDPERHEHAYAGMDYPVSKAALDMMTVRFAHALPQMRVNAVAPGFTATALNDFAGTQTVEEGAEAIVRAATVGADGPTASFIGRGELVPW